MSTIADARAPAAVGRLARLELTFERRGARTVLAHSYAEPPFRVGPVLDADNAAYVIVVTSGPGIFPGDALQQSIHVGAGARVILTSQSALQVHPAPSSLPAPPDLPDLPDPPDLPALIRQHYDVAEDAELQCHWDPVIPFARSRLDQRFDVRIAENSRLYWTDALMAGRVSRGEAWQFESLAHELRLQVGPALAYLERYRLRPAERAPERRWMAGGATHLASVLIHHPGATLAHAEALDAHLADANRAQGAADFLEPESVLARLMDSNGAAFRRLRASCRTFALNSIFGCPGHAPRK